MTDASNTLIGTSGLASRLGVSMSVVRKWERLGIIPPAPRVEGSNRRVYRLSEVDAIRDAIRTKEDRRRRAAA